jgi:hypothetical protein
MHSGSTLTVPGRHTPTMPSTIVSATLSPHYCANATPPTCHHTTMPPPLRHLPPSHHLPLQPPPAHHACITGRPGFGGPTATRPGPGRRFRSWATPSWPVRRSLNHFPLISMTSHLIHDVTSRADTSPPAKEYAASLHFSALRMASLLRADVALLVILGVDFEQNLPIWIGLCFTNKP